MAHPYHKHNDHDKSHARVGHLLKHEPKDQKRHDGKGWSHHVRSKHAAVAHDHKVPGHKKAGRYARGGRTKKNVGGNHTHIAVVVPQGKGGPQAGAGGPPPMPPLPPPGGGAAPALPPGGAPPGLPPGLPLRGGPGGPGGPPIMRRGGRVKHKAGGGGVGGDASATNLKGWSNRASAQSYARGGAADSFMTAGALSGEGRLEKAHHKR